MLVGQFKFPARQPCARIHLHFSYGFNQYEDSFCQFLLVVKKATGNIESIFSLQCVALYSKNALGDAKKCKLTVQLLLLIFPEEALASHFKPKQLKLEYFVV